MNAKLCTLAIVVLGAIPLCMNAGETKPAIPGARPCLVAISVADLDKSVKWYQDTLKFSVTKRLDLPKYSMRIAFLDLNGFQIEMIESKESVSFAGLQKRFPAVDDRAKIQGFCKIGFRVEKIDIVAADLKTRGIIFQRDIQTDAELHEKWFIISDPDDNWIQFFEKML